LIKVKEKYAYCELDKIPAVPLPGFLISGFPQKGNLEIGFSQGFSIV